MTLSKMFSQIISPFIALFTIHTSETPRWRMNTFNVPFQAFATHIWSIAHRAGIRLYLPWWFFNNILFYLTNMVKLYYPKVWHHFIQKLKIDFEGIFFGWLCTLLTTTIYEQEDTHHLDSIIDIFIIKGWLGFIKVILVILDRFKDEILMIQDINSLLKFFNSFTNSLQILDQKDIDFKREIGNYRNFKKINLSNLKCLFLQIQNEKDNFWHSLNS